MLTRTLDPKIGIKKEVAFKHKTYIYIFLNTHEF